MKQIIEIIIIVHSSWREANVLRPNTNSDVSEWPNLWKKIQKNMNHQQMWKIQHTETDIYDHVLTSKILENQLKEKASKFTPADQKWKGKISK